MDLHASSVPFPDDRHFDPVVLPCGPAAHALVAEAIATTEASEQRQRRRRKADQASFQAMVSSIVCNLVRNVVLRDQGGVAVPLSKTVLGKTSRYGSPVLRESLPAILGTMEQAGLLSILKGDGGRRTTIYPSSTFRGRVLEASLGPNDLIRGTIEETIVLKRGKVDRWGKAQVIEYEDTETTRAYREEMRRINHTLRAAPLSVLPGGPAIDTSDRTLRRVFNRGSFREGGRLFGGFWQAMRSRDRLDRIRIGNQPIAELDYGQIIARILYGMVGARPECVDLYAVPGYEAHRDGFKTLFASLFYRTSLPTRFPAKSRAKFPEGMNATEAVDLLRQRHRPIARLFGTEVGYEAMYRESEILVDVLLTLMEGEGVAALPIHDAILVSQDEAHKAHAVMRDTFRHHVGLDPIITVKGVG